MSDPLISVRGVGRSFQAGEETITVLRDVDLDIWPGEFVAIIGASGSGKSTLMNILGCLDRPSAGSYRFAGEDVGGLDPDALARLRREHFGFIFQRYQLLGDLDAVGNVEVPAIYAGEGRASRRARATELLTQLGLGTRLDHRPNELSGGQQQRVSVARALINGGEVILADEPTGALDTKSSAELIELLLELNAKGHTVIVVTHDPTVAAHARREIEISDGRIVRDSGRTEAGEGAARPATAERGAGALLRRASETLSMALKAMLAHRVRSFLTMLGIIIGIASVVLVVALGSGTQEKILQNISSLGTNTITVRAGTGFGARDAGKTETLMPSDASMIALQPYADGVSPAVSNSANVLHGNVSATAAVNGVSGDYFAVHAYETVIGQQFDTRDVTELSQVAVIDEDTRDTFFPNGEDPLGEVLILGHVPVRVIGVVRSTGATFGPSSLNVWIPYTTAMSRVSGQNYLDSIGVKIADSYDMTKAQSEITALMLNRHGTQDFFLSNSDTIRATITSTTETMTWLVAAIAVISLVVGGIGVMNIMLVSVTERTREIGVRVAVGARRSDIVGQFLVEAVLVCLVGGVLGIALALGAGALLGMVYTTVTLSFSGTAIVVAFLSSTLIGVTFGFLPARSAAQLDPVVALNRE
ncbi:MacB family efflux pump subunit [Sinirhodobacter ferrireducens]|uniref:Pyoverdine export ATP-binding/permease protein PvdT n=1 Tax=Paenirhodobacter ferrireducens TaxID=1215032 RepID=A0A443L695_9RHOB|nr:MacB family efflux pump subunit [Sinirhodobacter ferrireducens]RWR44538.1 MacB family efflux pump subunit [Sinirhodobacter ferrireducens]